MKTSQDIPRTPGRSIGKVQKRCPKPTKATGRPKEDRSRVDQVLQKMKACSGIRPISPIPALKISNGTTAKGTRSAGTGLPSSSSSNTSSSSTSSSSSNSSSTSSASSSKSDIDKEGSSIDSDQRKPISLKQYLGRSNTPRPIAPFRPSFEARVASPTQHRRTQPQKISTKKPSMPLINPPDPQPITNSIQPKKVEILENIQVMLAGVDSTTRVIQIKVTEATGISEVLTIPWAKLQAAKKRNYRMTTSQGKKLKIRLLTDGNIRLIE